MLAISVKRRAAKEFRVQTASIRAWEKVENRMLAIPENERRELFTLHQGPDI